MEGDEVRMIKGKIRLGEEERKEEKKKGDGTNYNSKNGMHMKRKE